jgi:hypothetical protein
MVKKNKKEDGEKEKKSDGDSCFLLCLCFFMKKNLIYSFLCLSQ